MAVGENRIREVITTAGFNPLPPRRRNPFNVVYEARP
jgi:hypothetical protein